MVQQPQTQARGAQLRIGEILVQAGLITAEQEQQAKEQQRALGMRFGEVLIKLGFVSEEDLQSAVAKQLGLAFLPSPETDVDMLVARLLSQADAQRYKAIPLKQEGTAVVVAMVDPMNFVAEEDIAMQLGRRVKRVVTTERGLKRVLARVYSGVAAGSQEASASDPAPTPTAASVIGENRVYNIEATESGSAVVRIVNTIFEQALGQRASDIHIEPLETQVRVRYRIDGVLHEVTPLPKNQYAAILSRIKVMGNMDIAERRLPQDGRIELEMQGRKLDVRVNTIPSVHGEKVAMRLLDRSRALLKLEQLFEPDLLETYRELINRPNGIILVTGPTGSGKTSTLLSTMMELNKPTTHILTIEDPVEYQIPGVNQVQVNIKAGLTFATGIRAFLRQDPEIMMVGEIRDGETAGIAVQAALTGHTVFSSLHTNEASGAFGRLIDMGVEPFLLASSAVGVVAQRLVRKLCERCKEPYSVNPSDPEAWMLNAKEEPVTIWRAKGCNNCDKTGYQGRKAIMELLVVTNELRELVNQGASAALLQEAAIKGGMRTLFQEGIRQVKMGATTLDEVQRVAFVSE